MARDAGFIYIVVVLINTVNALTYRIKTLNNILTGVSHTARSLSKSFSALTPWFKCNYKGITEFTH